MLRAFNFRAPLSETRFALGFVPLLIVWPIFHMVFWFAVSLATDGCTKCPFDSAEKRWEAIGRLNALFIGRGLIDVLLLGAFFLLYSRRMVALSQAVSARLLWLSVVSYGVAYADFWGTTIARMLRCGSDCVPSDPLLSSFQYFGYLVIPATIVFYASVFLNLRKMRDA